MEDELAAVSNDVNALKATLLAARADVARLTVEAAAALAEKSSILALIAHLKLQIEKLNRDRFGLHSARLRGSDDTTQRAEAGICRRCGLDLEAIGASAVQIVRAVWARWQTRFGSERLIVLSTG